MNKLIICLFLIFSIIENIFSINNLEWKELRLSVLLKWNTTNIPDYIQVLRRQNNTNQWEIITKLNSTETQYEDKEVKVIYDYFYKIRFITNNNVKVSNIILGHWIQTGTAQGRVLLGYSKGIPGLKVVALRYYDGEKLEGWAITDKNGNYKIEGLSYYNKGNSYYSIIVYFDQNIYRFCQSDRTGSAYFSEYNNYQKVRDICLLDAKTKKK